MLRHLDPITDRRRFIMHQHQSKAPQYLWVRAIMAALVVGAMGTAITNATMTADSPLNALSN